MFLKIDNVVKTYGKGAAATKVLKEISFKIKKSEICTILGPSGSGKSTILNIIGGLETVDSGSIYLEDQKITELKSSKLLDYRRKNLGFVFQFYNLISNLTAKENIEVCAELSKDSLDIDELLKTLELEDNKNKYPYQMSGGQQQRVSFARAIVKNPRLLLCDEPTGALDYKNSKEILAMIERLNKTYGTTIMIVTHNIAIGEMSDRVLYIRDGYIERVHENKNRKTAEEVSW